MLTLNDGRSELWQWDTGRTLAVDADCSQVHFSNKVFGRSIDVDVVDGAAIIPDVLLQTGNDLNVWAFAGTAENGYTKISKTFKVNRRNKPADYVFTPADQMTLQAIQRQIGDIDDLTTEAKDTLVAAINEAAASGGGSPDAVLYTAQTLTGAQKKQARENIDATASDFVINATITDISSMQCTLDKTYAQIREAVQDGNKPVVHFADPGGTGTVVMPLTLDFGSGFVFRVTFAVDDGVTNQIGQYIISALQDGRVIFDTSAALSLNSDGNLAQQTMAKGPSRPMQIATKKYVDDHAGVPSVTVADNGKFLRVVNGAWAAATINDANGVSF